jgi:acetylornithine/succinyldiaminopimelate/putrescine aminotransferase
MHPSEIQWLGAYKNKIKTPIGDLTDFTSAILVANLGHNNTNLSKKLSEVISGENPNLFCYQYSSDLRKTTEERIIKFCGESFKNIYMCCTGSEATEAAIRVAHSSKKEDGKSPYVIGFVTNFHGRTFGSALSTAILGSKFHSPNIVTLPPLDSFSNNKDLRVRIEQEISSNSGVFSGVIIEAFRGWDSHFWNPKYIREIYNICHKNNALLIMDEMQSGFYRTGKRFAYEYYNIVPDVLCIGKALGNGIPVSATIFGPKIDKNVIQQNLSSTFQAHSLGCVASKFVIETMEEKDFKEKLNNNILIFNALLEKISNKNIRVNKKGLVASILFSKSNQAKDTAIKLLEKKVLVIDTGKNALKLAPPLNSNTEELKSGLETILKTLESNL